MANTTREISNICRFCLCQNGLIPVSQATATLLTIQDIKHFTGIQITDEEQLSFAMCVACCKVLENSVAFRRTCVDNDIIFRQLFSVLIESVMDGLEDYKETTQVQSVPLEDESDDQADADEVLVDVSPNVDHAIDSLETISVDSESEYSNQDSERGVEIKTTINHSTNHLIQAGNNSPKSKGKTKRKRVRVKRLCSICGKLVPTLSDHIIQYHSKEKRCACPHCPIKMTNATNMKRHIEQVHERKIIKSCDLCGAGFINIAAYKCHMMAKHGIGKTYECTICSKTFINERRYNAHKNKWHKPKTEHPCPTCGKVFWNRENLTVHQRVHSDHQPYQCSLCPKRFKTTSARNCHVVTHTGIRFSCTLCKKSYSSKKVLNLHYRKEHKGEIPSV